jgi:hypothetical protein
MAVENAPQHERIWIEEGYAAIFCATNQIVRAEAGVLVARWRQTFLRPDGAVARTGSFEMLPERQCSSGERVALAPPGGSSKMEVAAGSAAPVRPVTAESLKTTPAPVGFKAAGIVEAARTRK